MQTKNQNTIELTYAATIAASDNREADGEILQLSGGEISRREKLQIELNQIEFLFRADKTVALLQFANITRRISPAEYRRYNVRENIPCALIAQRIPTLQWQADEYGAHTTINDNTVYARIYNNRVFFSSSPFLPEFASDEKENLNTFLTWSNAIDTIAAHLDILRQAQDRKELNARFSANIPFSQKYTDRKPITRKAKTTTTEEVSEEFYILPTPKTKKEIEIEKITTKAINELGADFFTKEELEKYATRIYMKRHGAK